VHEDRADAGLGAARAERLQDCRVVLREAPRARALREQLHRVRTDLDSLVERARDAA
jgi:hypothetical protein